MTLSKKQRAEVVGPDVTECSVCIESEEDTEAA